MDMVFETRVMLYRSLPAVAGSASDVQDRISSRISTGNHSKILFNPAMLVDGSQAESSEARYSSISSLTGYNMISDSPVTIA